MACRLIVVLFAAIHFLSASSSSSSSSLGPASPYSPLSQPSLIRDATLLQTNARPPGCPPCPECFNCQLPKFNCKQFGTCSEYDGQCKCPVGFGGQDCGEPVCGSLADGDQRHVRQDNSTSCKCEEGWTGINCNVCENDQACAPLVPPFDHSTGRLTHPNSSPLSPSEYSNKSEAVCYKGGYTVKESYQMCNVTNRKILDMLPGRPPQASFTCNTAKQSCQFQFWIGYIESFYCAFDDCQQSVQVGYQGQPNITRNECKKMQCKCIPGRMLCGESGSVDISDFLSQEIKGPGKFSCSSDQGGCQFEEPAMNQLITDIFGDTSITLNCQAGECMHYTMVPGFTVPERPDNSKMVALSIALTAFFVAGASWMFWYCGRNRAHKYPAFYGKNRLNSAEQDALASHVPTDLHFSKITYSIHHSKPVLRQVSGKAKSGQLLAIMGASGAGKSSLLDILAKKSKSGFVAGDILVNDMQISNDQFKSLIGYVDQEDTLMSTLTVYEAVLCSAMLRLPKDMNLDAKKIRTLETLDELGILHLKDAFIGRSGRRSISGGEKRRVSIACELVTNPSILFLDEPTSGLDSFNAYNVVESLSQLAKNYQRTIILTIHQPQSNIVSLFDQLVLLGHGGRLIYSGAFEACHDYFAQIGHACPAGYNVADFLIDLTMKYRSSNPKTLTGPSHAQQRSIELHRDSGESGTYEPEGDETELLLRNSSEGSRTSKSTLQALRDRLTKPQDDASEDFSLLDHLVESYEASEISQSFDKDFQAVQQRGLVIGPGAGDPLYSYLIARGQDRVGFVQQFLILSSRAFKNLYRNPMLMLSHYLLAILLAGVCASLFHGVTLDIAGFQGRMGLFFFILALFGFSSLTAITIFSEERILFMRERSNNYYSPFSYFLSKTILDIFPLRILPPFILSCIIYYPVGLVPTLEQFWKFVLVLIAFNLVSFSLVLLISLVCEDVGVANLVGSLIMLFNLLFAGLLVNREKLPYGTAWLQDISFYHAAFEGLLINEVRYLTLKDHRYGVDIEVPSASILSLFGFRTTAFWYPDMANLTLLFLFFMTLSFLTLVFLVKERR
ncbi:hypothetical protein PCASD_13765 [Puccinia coronata f. sp. avenae]|uniref:ABC transporter domain-containing protein n=1 Tax=Puccinia coronata f. sp. avenae TaxID=200324 RepID=A0A2N5UL68_9BASI|nr:hypothetical protein PCASD_13765 [Puccinia coronata f. sp. avenae]